VKAAFKVGDLVRVSQNCIVPYLGIVVSINSMGGALVRSTDGSRASWAYDWFAEVINASR
jgi:small-conductance mechanosensitive channel